MRQGHPFWQAPHRPLFLLAALSALAVPAVWLVPHGTGPEPVSWHLRELTFGMGGAAVGGYLLTSLPSWTRQGPVAPQLTMAMCALWCLSRVSFFWAEHVPYAVLAVGTQAYLAALVVLLGWTIGELRLWPKVWLVAAIGVLIASDLAYLGHLHRHGASSFRAMEIVLAFALLISLVGGRAVPAFTRSWLARQSVPGRMRERTALSVLATVLLICGGLLAAVGRERPAGAFLMLSGALQLARSTGWKTWRVRRYPALLLLHLAWLWLPVGLMLVGLAMMQPAWMPLPAALHALTMGAMGTMILAIMARSAMARRDDILVLNKRLGLAFALVWLSALLRVSAPFAPSDVPDPIHASAVLWMAGWLLFLWVYVPSLRGPYPRPVLSARLGA